MNSNQFLGYPHWDIIANTFLFLSALILLINLAPRDFIPFYSNQKEVLLKLGSDKNILGTLPKHIQVTPVNSGMSIVQDQDAFLVLRDMARKYSPNSNGIDWNNIIGIGYSVISAPVGKYTVDAFEPVYVVEIPPDNSSVLVLKPFGNMNDFKEWFSTEHSSAVNTFALVLLVIGFLIQLLVGCRVLGIKML